MLLLSSYKDLELRSHLCCWLAGKLRSGCATQLLAKRWELNDKGPAMARQLREERGGAAGPGVSRLIHWLPSVGVSRLRSSTLWQAKLWCTSVW